MSARLASAGARAWPASCARWTPRWVSQVGEIGAGDQGRAFVDVQGTHVCKDSLKDGCRSGMRRMLIENAWVDGWPVVCGVCCIGGRPRLGTWQGRQTHIPEPCTSLNPVHPGTLYIPEPCTFPEPCRVGTQVGALSRALAVRTLQLEMEYVYSYLEEEALDIAQGSQAAGWLLFRQARAALFVVAAFWAHVPLNARSAPRPSGLHAPARTGLDRLGLVVAGCRSPRQASLEPYDASLLPLVQRASQ